MLHIICAHVSFGHRKVLYIIGSWKGAVYRLGAYGCHIIGAWESDALHLSMRGYQMSFGPGTVAIEHGTKAIYHLGKGGCYVSFMHMHHLCTTGCCTSPPCHSNPTVLKFDGNNTYCCSDRKRGGGI